VPSVANFHVFDDVTCHASCDGKKTAWETQKALDEVFDEVTTALCTCHWLPHRPFQLYMTMDLLERFFVVLYDPTSSQEHVNKARKHLFAHSGKSIEVIPSTQEALTVCRLWAVT